MEQNSFFFIFQLGSLLMICNKSSGLIATLLKNRKAVAMTINIKENIYINISGMLLSTN